MKSCCLLALCGALLIAAAPAGATNGASIGITPSVGEPLKVSQSEPGLAQAVGS